MKKLILLISLFVGTNSIAQSVTIDPKSTANGIINAQSNNKGIVLPSNANPPANIVAPAAGTMVYNSNSQTPNYYNGSAWQNLTNTGNMGYKNMKVFHAGVSTWTIPAGVTTMTIEAWGGGGGGNTYQYYANGILAGNGGGAGAYAFYTTNVVENTLLTIKVGFGGGGGSTINTLGSTGQFSRVEDGNQFYVTAWGGTYAFGGQLINNAGVSGENGHNLDLSYGNSSASNYNLIIKLGDGGYAYKGGKGGKGEWFVSQNSNNLLFSNYNLNNANGGIPGGGGGAVYLNDTQETGGNGGNGMVIIYY